MKKFENFNHPRKGAAIAAQPITSLSAITQIKLLLERRPRDLALFTVGINTNLRISDLLALRVGDVNHLRVGDTITLKQKKRGKYGIRVINAAAHAAIEYWLGVHPNIYEDSFLFCGKEPGKPITREYASRLIKSWCKDIGLRGRFSAHTLRKTFGYHAVNTFSAKPHVVVAAFGHKNLGTTLSYLGVQDEDVKELFMNTL